jgi:hypothetical protein
LKIILFLLSLIAFSSLIAEEPTFKEKMEIAQDEWSNYNWELYISPVVLPELGIGCTKRKMLTKSYHEGTHLLHVDIIPSIWELNVGRKDYYKIEFWGLKYRSSYFYKPDYSGFNWFFNIGFQALYIDLSLDPGGSSGSSNPRWVPFPDLALGCGYSWKLQNEKYFRISLDAGVKLVISNLYFSYVW